jgi:hypothetical protein
MLKHPDLEKERSERKLSSEEFLDRYNENLPTTFPRATSKLLDEFRSTFPRFFKRKDIWTLGEHRKKLMDWLSQRMRKDSDSN